MQRLFLVALLFASIFLSPSLTNAQNNTPKAEAKPSIPIPSKAAAAPTSGFCKHASKTLEAINRCEYRASDVCLLEAHKAFDDLEYNSLNAREVSTQDALFNYLNDIEVHGDVAGEKLPSAAHIKENARLKLIAMKLAMEAFCIDEVAKELGITFSEAEKR